MIHISQTEMRFNLMRFLTSRVGSTSRENAKNIIKSLSDKKSNGVDDGWVRARDLYNEFVKTGEISHSTQFFRILDKLAEFGVIEKKTGFKEKGTVGGKEPVYYRVPMLFPISWFEGPIEDPLDTIFRLTAELNAAKKWIRNLTSMDPATIDAKIDEQSRWYGKRYTKDSDKLSYGPTPVT